MFEPRVMVDTRNCVTVVGAPETVDSRCCMIVVVQTTSACTADTVFVMVEMCD